MCKGSVIDDVLTEEVSVEVTGIDVSQIQLIWSAPAHRFQIDDATEKGFHYRLSSMQEACIGCVLDWPAIDEEVMKYASPATVWTGLMDTPGVIWSKGRVPASRRYSPLDNR